MGYSSAADIPYAVVEERTFIHRVYGWMTGGLIVTALIALFTAATPALIKPITESRGLFFGLIIGELIVVMALSASIQRISPFAAGIGFVFYAVLNGLTLSIVFVAFELGSIYSAFFVTAGTFGAMSLYGYTTKRDLTSIGNLCGMALFGLILAMLASFIFPGLRGPGASLIINGLGVLIFVGLTAYDTQKIKAYHRLGRDGSDADKKAAIMGALRLYLDFINLFLFMLRLMGRRR